MFFYNKILSNLDKINIALRYISAINIFYLMEIFFIEFIIFYVIL